MALMRGLGVLFRIAARSYNIYVKFELMIPDKPLNGQGGLNGGTQ